MEIDESGFHEGSARRCLNIGERVREFVEAASVNMEPTAPAGFEILRSARNLKPKYRSALIGLVN